MRDNIDAMGRSSNTSRTPEQAVCMREDDTIQSIMMRNSFNIA